MAVTCFLHDFSVILIEASLWDRHPPLSTTNSICFKIYLPQGFSKLVICFQILEIALDILINLLCFWSCGCWVLMWRLDLSPFVIQGLGEQELAGVPFRFANDLQLVAHERKLLSLADFIHQMCTVHGLADFELAGHQLEQKQYPPAPQQPVIFQ